MPFVHLRTHTEYSVVDGTLRIDEAVAAAAADRQVAMAITDLSNLFGAIKFYSATLKAGVKPVIGADVWLEPTGGEKSPSRLVLLVQSRSLTGIMPGLGFSHISRKQRQQILDLSD